MESRNRNPVIEYLRQALYLDVQIDAAFERIRQLRALAERRTAVYGGSGGGVGGGVSDHRADVVAKIVDAERNLDAEINRLLALRSEIEGVIGRVPDERMRTLLKLRYMNNCTWDRIADKLEVSEQWIFKLHGRALQHVKKILDS